MAGLQGIAREREALLENKQTNQQNSKPHTIESYVVCERACLQSYEFGGNNKHLHPQYNNQHYGDYGYIGIHCKGLSMKELA